MTEVTLSRLNSLSHPLVAYLIVAIELVMAIAIGFGLTAIGMNGAAWIVAGMAAGAIVFRIYHALVDIQLPPNRNARKIGQLIIGLTIGLSLQQGHLSTLSSQLPVFLGLPLFLLLGGGVVGVIYARIEQTDLLTALLATTPGNIGVMASIAADYSKNATLVSLIQLLRFTVVIFAMPMIANVTIAHTAQPALTTVITTLLTIPWQDLMPSGLVLGIAALIAYFGGKAKIPMATFLGAIAVGLSFDLLPILFPTLPLTHVQIPPLFNLVGQVLLGITIGEYWGLNPRLQWSTVTLSAIPVGLIMAIGLIAAGLIRAITAWDWLTCLLVAAPGGSPEMIWIALTLNHNVEIITAGHLVRLLTINLSLPLLISLAHYLDQQGTNRENQAIVIADDR